MRILVSVKRVPDPNLRLRVKADGSGIETAGLRWVMNPYDEVALEQAIRWKESGVVTEVIAASVGGDGCKDMLRSALALGADRAVHLRAADDVAPLGVATALCELVRGKSCDLILLGAQNADDGATETGPMLAALLDWPQATRVFAAALADKALQVERVADSGVETLALDLPCVLTADLRLAAPRFANVGAVLQAKKASIEERATAATSTHTVVAMTPVARTRAGRRVASAHELVAALRRNGAL